MPGLEQRIQETTQGQSTVVPQNQTFGKKQNNSSTKPTTHGSVRQPVRRAGQLNRNKTNLKGIRENGRNPKSKNNGRIAHPQPTGFQLGAPPNGFKAAVGRLEKLAIRIGLQRAKAAHRDPEAPSVLRVYPRQDVQRDNLRS
ncbi:unnamed protein product [Echinostoma caproni]|uniref:Reverse transcriptase domain-containing protein n=1 Tax=Echinostoma caproni TaxID=27848 RepID=A0A183B9T8_9TREM|nr:unnamed protein product [Echinostoma caproni]